MSKSFETRVAWMDEVLQLLQMDAVYQALGTRSQGLTHAEAQARLAQVGPNALREAPGKPLWWKFVANFTHLMALLLWVGGIVGFIAQLPQLGIAIWMVNVINGSFSFWQEFKAERATEALKRLLSPTARVYRDDQEQRIPAEEVVPGDILLLSEGDRIAADARLIQAAELRVDQSTLTGEATPVRKTSEPVLRTDLDGAEAPNLVFAGTVVASGTGQAIVHATGMKTEFGKIAHLTQTVGDQPSPLQREMDRVTRVVTFIAVGIGALFFLLAVLVAQVTLVESFIFAMGMIVAFVPEGMLPTVTLALAMGVQRMARRHALIKRLSAVETLGSATVICTDKTGTLTQNEMTAREVWVGGRRYTVSGVGYAPEGEVGLLASALEAGRPAAPPPLLEGQGRQVDPDLRRALVVAALCNNARVLPPNSESPRWTVLGDPTEAALRVLAVKAGLDLDAEARRTPRVFELPFESRRKRMSTIHIDDRRPTTDETGQLAWQPNLSSVPTGGFALVRRPSSVVNGPSSVVAFVKGAPKEVLALCRRIHLEGAAVPLTEAMREQIVAANDEYARKGLRVLAMAERPIADESQARTAEDVEQDLTFLGLVAMMDPPRPEVAAAVERCHHAGIRIIMITGDYGLTAESIARRIGIIRGERPRIVTGVEMEGMDEGALEDALKAEVIFARVAPEHKLRVVQALQALGQIVAVTGDGVNDAPALKRANIGVAMGIAGTDVAKEAADMILTDDNFASIVNAIEEGRTVYANIKKFIAYIFTSNTAEAVPFILFVLSAGRIPLALNVMQVLAIDLGTDMAPALALGAEPPEPGVMDRPPRAPQEHVISRDLLMRSLVVLGLAESVVSMIAFLLMYWTNGYWGQWLDLPGSGALYLAATAMALAGVVVAQIGNLFAHRTELRRFWQVNLFSNRLIWVGIAAELLLIGALIYLPPLQGVFETQPFPLVNWLFLFAWIPALPVVDEVRKWATRRR